MVEITMCVEQPFISVLMHVCVSGVCVPVFTIWKKCVLK